jgi:NADH-quinone oxidoreductase subunit M
MMQTDGLRSIRKMGGLAARMPLTAAAALIGFVTITGLPPTSGFISEFLIFAGSFHEAFQLGSMLRVMLSFLAVLSTVLTAGYSLWAVRRIFFGQLPAELDAVRDPPLTMIIPMLVLSVISILIGIFPDIIEHSLLPAVKMIVGG